jgi:hypothetical protein
MFAAMVMYKGYPLERHVTVTGDGYKLATFRIPYGRQGAQQAAGGGGGKVRQPVLLLHGISLASTCWVVNDPDQSLAFILADRGARTSMLESHTECCCTVVVVMYMGHDWESMWCKATQAQRVPLQARRRL